MWGGRGRCTGTLDLLFTTHLTSREIILGKLGSRVVVTSLLVFGGLPVLSLTQLFGGVSLQQVLRLEAVALLAVVYLGGIAIFFSTLCRGPLQNSIATYLAAGIGSALIPFVSPVWPFMLALAEDQPTSWTFFLLNFLLPLATVVVLVAIAIRQLRGYLNRLSGSSPSASQRIVPRDLRDRRSRTCEAEATAWGWLAANCAMWGALRIPVDRDDPPLRENLWVFGVLAVGFSICFYVLGVVNPVQKRARISILLVPIWAAVLSITVLLAVTNPLFTRRPGFFDLLLQTTLRPAEILQGTVLVSLPVLIRLYVVPLLFSLLWSPGNLFGLLRGGAGEHAWALDPGPGQPLLAD